ncbi:MAG: carbohydrate kinase [Spirochaetaceae bacterium]|jgi:fructokinase|nr:carbohydrate kinase [Spirochaetaceae bacterium]
MILCCGEALIDMVPLRMTQTQREKTLLPEGGTGFFPYPGGSSYNTALAIGRLGVPVRFLGRISKDFFGEQLIGHLIKNKVGIDLIVRSEEHSTLAFVKLEAGKEPQYVFYTEGTADRSFSQADLPVKLPEETHCILFGSIAMTMEPVATTIESLIFQKRGRAEDGPVISIDPNIRPFMIRDKDAYCKRFEGWVAASTIVKISSADLAFVYPNFDLEASLQRLLNMGPRLVVTTLGPEGAFAALRRDTGIIRANAPVVHSKVVDTIGAGDTFHGALLSWLDLKGKMSRSKLVSLTEGELHEALFFANKAASLVCARQGADPPTLPEVEAL